MLTSQRITIKSPANFKKVTCKNCADNLELDFTFSMAFQPIVDFKAHKVIGYEALVRGADREPAKSVLKRVTDRNLYRFDQMCRYRAIELASRLGMTEKLHINFFPNAVYKPELCIRTTLEAAKLFKFPEQQIVFEVTEVERVVDTRHIADIASYYKSKNMQVALDDFGAGYSDLRMLLDVKPSIVKLDLSLARNIHEDRARQIVVGNTVKMCDELDVKVIVEGVESKAELDALLALGCNFFQGYYFAEPRFEALPKVNPNAFR